MGKDSSSKGLRKKLASGIKTLNGIQRELQKLDDSIRQLKTQFEDLGEFLEIASVTTVNVLGKDKKTTIEEQIVDNGSQMVNQFHGKFDTTLKRQRVNNGSMTNIF